MVTLHYSGNMVKHPDTKAAYNRKIERYEKEGKCLYGVTCYKCPFFQQKAKQQPLNKPLNSSVCHYTRHKDCPGNIKQQQAGKERKKFTLTGRHYREIADRTAWMFQNAKSKILFITLTFPKFKRDVTETELNQAFSKFVENLASTYKRGHYLAVREGTTFEQGNDIDKRYHYHLVIELPFIDFRTLNNSWLHAISDFCEPSSNALTTDREARFIKSVASVVRYISKYISKAKGQGSSTRIIFTDRETAQAQIKTRIDNHIDEFKEAFKTLESYELNDYVTVYSIRDRREADRFFNQVVKILFDSHSPGTELYHFPDSNTQ